MRGGDGGGVPTGARSVGTAAERGELVAVDGLAVSSAWLAAAPALREEFEAAEPFPLLVLDDFLDRDLAAALVDEFPRLDAMPKSRDYLFADKRELSSVERAGPAGARWHRTVTSAEFAEFLASATGLEAVFVDPQHFGGGFHQSGDGGYLDMHVDFNVHPAHDDWLRVLNVLVYLNPGWDDTWGGDLLVKARPDDEPRAIAPRFNRAVIMRTDAKTYHGFRRMTLPPGTTRRSIAAYAYQRVDAPVRKRTTGWVPEGAPLAKRLVARNYGRVVQLKNRVAGSATGRNR